MSKSKKMGLQYTPKVGDKLLTLAFVYAKLPHYFTVVEVRPSGAIIDERGHLHPPIECGTIEQYESDCTTIATNVSGEHRDICPKCNSTRGKK